MFNKALFHHDVKKARLYKMPSLEVLNESYSWWVKCLENVKDHNWMK